MPMRVGFVQFRPIWGNKDRNLRAVDALLGEVSADLIVLPELFSTGYIFASRRELLALAESVPDGPTCRALADLARDHAVTLIGGVAERAGARCFNTAFLVTPTGQTARYRKVHLFDREKLLFTPGCGGFPVFLVAGVRIGLLVCFDWIFPEAMRTLALDGAQIVCHCANLVLPYCQEAMITRALENGLHVITANRVGTESRAGQRLVFTGASQVVDPRGRILVRAPRRQACAEAVTIDPALGLDKWVTPRNHLLRDRRPAQYGLGDRRQWKPSHRERQE
jgi:predicted amidohydrolase